MEKQFKQNKIQLILYSTLFILFLKSNSPVIVLTLFLTFCGLGIDTFVYITNGEHNKVISGGKRAIAQTITALILQMIVLFMIGVIVWLFLDRKIEIFKPLLK